MINPLINSIVVGGFGFIIGIVLQIAMRVMPERMKTSSSINFEKGLRGLFDSAMSSAERSREMVQSERQGIKGAMLAFYGLIGVLILVLLYSPLLMNWPAFLLSLLVGFLLFEIIFKGAITGKIVSPSSSTSNSSEEIIDNGT